MNIALITTRGEPSRKGSIMQEVVAYLAEKSIPVETIYPEESPVEVFDIRPRYDLYILKSGTEMALSFTSALHEAGAAILNPYPAVAKMKDKIVTTKVLQAAGAPIPEAYFAAQATQLAPLLSAGALVIKPFWAGSKGRGVQVVREIAELNNISTSEGLIFAQRYYEPDGRDQKIYCIGKQLFGVRRVWPARTLEDKLGEPFEVTPQMKEIALQCGQAFGVDLFGIDIIYSGGQPFVVDINSFPGFKGVPDAARLLADYIYSATEKISNKVNL
jgi:ribosomal protein S6--L-glutamate ligase